MMQALRPTDSLHKPVARYRYIHSDQRGAPLAMTGQAREIVWRTDLTAWGTARPMSATQSRQLMNLLAAPDIALGKIQNESTLPASLRTVNCKAPLQLFGEALHALQDTFAHRNKDDESYSPTWRPLGMPTHIGIGHGLAGHNPDLTYDHGDWKTNYERMMVMAETVYAQMVTFAGKIGSTGQAKSWSDIKSVVGEFASIPASEGSGDMVAKIKVLSDWLNDSTMKWAEYKNSAGNGYNKFDAEKNRDNFLKNLKPDDFPGVML